MDTASLPEVKPLTDRQREIYEWIFEFTKRNGFQSSYREAGKHFGFVSHAAGIRSAMMAFARKGWIDHRFGIHTQARAIRFLLTPDDRPFRGFDVRIGDGLPDIQPLTDRQMEIYQWFFEFTMENGFQPTIREAMVHFAVVSTNAIDCLLQMIQTKGWIDCRFQARAIRFLVTPDGKPFRGFVEKGDEDS